MPEDEIGYSCNGLTRDEANDVLRARFSRWERDRQQRPLKTFLESLDWRRREVTILWYGNNLTREQVAEKLGVSVRTVADDLDYVREAAVKHFA